jgi:sec-independent protein translocase protein TatC
LLDAIFADHLRSYRPDLVELVIWQPVDTSVQALGVVEPFMIYIKAALVVGLILSSPWVFFQIWSFVAAGLYPHEKKFVHRFLPFSIGLFLLGTAIAFCFVFEPVLDFLFRFNRQLNISAEPRISDWIGFVLILPLGFGLSFQLPLVMLLLERLGVITVEGYLAHWRISVLIVFVLSMFLTPADPMSMLLMAVPLTALYFGGIALCKYAPRIQPAEDSERALQTTVG